MKIRSVLWCLFVALSGAVVAGTAANTLADSQPAQQSPTSEKPRALIRSVEGADLYREYCASCHGKMGKGMGRSPALKATVPDLTVIAKKNGGSSRQLACGGLSRAKG
ncbi:MAG: c-type cytochrome [Candidatus Acidiferrales bacterium]